MKRTMKSILAVALSLVIMLSLAVSGLSASAAKAIPAPTNVRTQNSGTGFVITWNKAAGAVKYRAFYKTAESDWAYQDTNTNSVCIQDLEYGKLYYIQLQSFGSNNARGSYSKVTSMTHVRGTVLKTAAYNANGTVTLGWDKADGANGYAVAKRSRTDNKYTYYYTSDTSFTDKDVKGGTVYYYQINPYYTNGKSAAYSHWSNTKSLITLFRPSITSINCTTERMNINWNSISGAKSYKLAFKRATDSAWNFRVTSSRYYNVAKPTEGATYYIQVCAVCDDLASPYSAVTSYKAAPNWKYYEAGETVKVTHPAETELVWVVDEAAHDETKTEVKSVYHYRICQCPDCGAVMDGWTADQIREHDLIFHGIGIYWNGETILRYPISLPYSKPKSGYVNEPVDTILHVAEKGHYEVKVIKEAWEEEVTIAQSGWYTTVTHPAETAQAKVIDKAAYYYEEPVYEYVYKHLCWGCDADVTEMTDKETSDHGTMHHNKGEISGYRKVKLQIKTGTNTINVSETAHNATVTTKESWNELVFVTDK